MKCPLCKGRKVEQILTDGMVDIVNCKCCSGTGVVEPLTNEEWFCRLPTYKKAILMANCYDAFNLDQYACNKHVVIEEWLKQPHKE